MSGNTFQNLVARITKLSVENNIDGILNILRNELNEVKLPVDSTVLYCGCGYPQSYSMVDTDYKNENVITFHLLKEILNEETDFDHYRIEYYCPKCGRFIEAIQC